MVDFFLVSFIFNYTATTEIDTHGHPLSLHDARRIWRGSAGGCGADHEHPEPSRGGGRDRSDRGPEARAAGQGLLAARPGAAARGQGHADRDGDPAADLPRRDLRAVDRDARPDEGVDHRPAEGVRLQGPHPRSEEHTSELQSLMRT